MADLVITTTSVIPGADAQIVFGRAGEALAQGKQAYLDSSSKKWLLADSNSATAAARVASGTVLNAAALDQPVAIAKSGQVAIGATLVAGTDYYLSDTPGGICPIADVGTGEYVCRVGMAISASVMQLDYRFSNVVK